MSDQPAVVQDSEDAYEAIRSINHRNQAVPAPVLYDVLGNLKYAGGYHLAEALTNLSHRLGRSLDEYDVYDTDGKDPVHTAATAVDALTAASELARQIGVLLDQAQTTIATQGYRP